MAENKKKKVRVESETTDAATKEAAANWKPTPEAKQQATTKRILAAVAWTLAIGLEAFAIFWLLRQVPFETSHLIWLIVVLVVIAGLAITGSMLWKQANRLDPASKQQKVRFFVQNQLGAIITVIAFLPLIVLILVNKNVDGRQKAIAAAVAIVLALGATALGIDFAPVSKEQVVAESNEVVALTGQDLVFWTKSGEVYHLCEAASAVNQESKDNTIYSGTVAQALAAGKSRLTKQVDIELKQCGITAPSASAEPSDPAESASSEPSPSTTE